MNTYITEINDKWYAYEGDLERDQVYSIGRDNPRENGRWMARWTDEGIKYVSSASPNRKAAVAKARRYGNYCGTMPSEIVLEGGLNTGTNRIEIDLGNGYKLVAERNPDSSYDREIFIGIEKAGTWTQDLAMVRPEYRYEDEDSNPRWKDNQFEVFVWSNHMVDNWTDSYQIDLHE